MIGWYSIVCAHNLIYLMKPLWFIASTSEYSLTQEANTRPMAESGPPPYFIRPGTLFLPGSSAKLLAPG